LALRDKSTVVFALRDKPPHHEVIWEVTSSLMEIAARLCQAGASSDDAADLSQLAMDTIARRETSADRTYEKANHLLAYELMGRLADEYARRCR
jgi:hypothetical protein